jgi:GT2 family glycosyltransferase
VNVRLCIVSATPALLEQAVSAAAKHRTGPIDICVFANGEATWPTEAWLETRGGGKATLDGVSQNAGVTVGLHRIWELAVQDGTPAEGDILVYIHDDVEIRETGWDQRVRRRFEVSPASGLVTFGGAKRLGSSDIYRTSYAMHQLARGTFLSNMGNAEAHGARTTTEQPIATPDGFSMAIRRSLLDRIGGWSWYPFPHHNYDNAIACQVRRHGYESWLVPVACEHFGGRTATVGVYQDFAQREWGGDSKVHADSHVWLYNEFRDVLPLLV